MLKCIRHEKYVLLALISFRECSLFFFFGGGGGSKIMGREKSLNTLF